MAISYCLSVASQPLFPVEQHSSFNVNFALLLTEWHLEPASIRGILLDSA